MFLDTAWAAPAAASQGGPFGSLMMIVIIFVVFYFLLIRPQSKRAKEHRKMVEVLGVGDEVVTSGGVLGRITELGEQFVKVEIADGTVVSVQRHTIGALMPKGTYKSA